MKINLVSIGKLNPHLQKIFHHYNKQLKLWTSINVYEINEVKEKNIEIKKIKETKKIMKKIPNNSEIFLCSLQGAEFTSEKFSKFIISKPHITFVIGGSYGVDESKFKNKIQFSKMTFPHQLFRVILIEQIYRAFSIKNNSKYHK